MTRFTERGAIEVSVGFREAVAALRRRRSQLQAQVGVIEAEIADLGKIEAALSIALEAVNTAKRTFEEAKP